MLICNHCGNIIKEEDAPTYEEAHPYGEGFVYEKCTDICPFCRQGDLVEATKCPVCDVIYIIKDEETICADCLEENMTLENCLEMGEDIAEEIEINNFWRFVFRDSEIEEMLRKTFNELPNFKQKEYIQKYCNEDKYFYEDFIQRKAKEKC